MPPDAWSTRMSFYEFLKFVHVLAAVVWVGGNAVMQVLAFRAQRSREPVRVAAFAGDAEWVGTRVFMPSALVLLIFGVWAAADGNWDFGDAWITIGFAAFLFSFLVGMLFLGPESGRIKKVVKARGVDHPEVQRRIARVFAVSRVELVVLIVAIWAMVAKPGL